MDIESYAGDILFLWGTGGPKLFRRPYRVAPRGGQNDPLKLKKIDFEYIMFTKGSKALRGNLSPPGVAPRGVKNHP